MSHPNFIDAIPGGHLMIRTRPALAAAEELLCGGQWRPWTEVVSTMVDASDIAPKSASNRIRSLIKAGVLERRGRYPDRQLRISPRCASRDAAA